MGSIHQFSTTNCSYWYLFFDSAISWLAENVSPMMAMSMLSRVSDIMKLSKKKKSNKMGHMPSM